MMIVTTDLKIGENFTYDEEYFGEFILDICDTGGSLCIDDAGKTGETGGEW